MPFFLNISLQRTGDFQSLVIGIIIASLPFDPFWPPNPGYPGGPLGPCAP